jgi:cation:H+ antiporter
MSKLAPIALVPLAAVTAFLLRASMWAPPVEVSTALFGLAIVAAAFGLSWAAEAAERDVPRALALTAVALLAVLPEYSVDIVFAWKAGHDPSFATYAAANMTGSNRLLLGMGWPAVVGFAWLRRRKTIVQLDRGSINGLAFLGVATVYSFLLPLKSCISLADSAVLFALFAAYAALVARAEMAEPDLVGPAATIGALPPRRRRLTIAGLLGLAFLIIAASAEPFAEGLIHTGRSLHVDEFLLVQWLAPFASEAPEFLVAALLASRGKATAALGLLVSAKLNQWTLRVGSLPVAYSVGAGHAAGLALDQRQTARSS